ncbi:uncharacterized protein [Drosophila suzukii]|uniref:RING-type domain-containing protein n=1 Tax=Drosophila suzukii TaxID=28584 RepID=A0AB40A014_DROSZ
MRRKSVHSDTHAFHSAFSFKSSLLTWKPIKMKFPRRAADEVQPDAIIDLTHLDEIQPVPRRLADRNYEPYLCPICIEPPEGPVATLCGHIFCMRCLIPAMRLHRICPMCKQIVSEIIRLHL